MPWSRVNTEYSVHRVQHTPSTAYTEYSIHRVKHTLNTAYTEYSIHRVQHTLSSAYTAYCIFPRSTVPRSQPVFSALSGPCCTKFSTFPQLRVNQWIECQLPPHMPPDLLPPDSLPPDWLPPDWAPSDQSPPDQPPPSTPSILIDYGLQVYLPTRSITASKCISEFTWSRPPSASPNSLNYNLQVHLWVHLISRSPSASSNLLDRGLQVHLWVNSISVSKCISKHAQSWPPISPSKSDGGCAEIQR